MHALTDFGMAVCIAVLHYGSASQARALSEPKGVGHYSACTSTLRSIVCSSACVPVQVQAFTQLSPYPRARVQLLHDDQELRSWHACDSSGGGSSCSGGGSSSSSSSSGITSGSSGGRASSSGQSSNTVSGAPHVSAAVAAAAAEAANQRWLEYEVAASR